MATYDYKKGKQRVKDILDNKLEIIENDKLPSIENLTYSNAYKSWVTAIFVDIRESTKLFTEEDKSKVSKIIRSFTSEVIEILRDDDNLREIGIRGDCVYAIYTSPQKENVYECCDKAIYVNTYMDMLNKLLVEKSFSKLKIGIGVGTEKELIVKAGRKDSGINNTVWIGDAVTKASNLSSIANKWGNESLLFSNTSYINIIKQLIANNKGENVESWFTVKTDSKLGIYYSASIIKREFNNWIKEGMNI